MKNKLCLLLCLILSIIFIPNVYADEFTVKVSDFTCTINTGTYSNITQQSCECKNSNGTKYEVQNCYTQAADSTFAGEYKLIIGTGESGFSEPSYAVYSNDGKIIVFYNSKTLSDAWGNKFDIDDIGNSSMAAYYDDLEVATVSSSTSSTTTSESGSSTGSSTVTTKSCADKLLDAKTAMDTAGGNVNNYDLACSATNQSDTCKTYCNTLKSRLSTANNLYKTYKDSCSAYEYMDVYANDLETQQSIYDTKCVSATTTAAASTECEDGDICDQGHIGEDFCSQKQVQNLLYVIGIFIWIAKLFIPLLVIGFGTFDLMKAVTGGDEKAISEGAKKFGIRLVIGLSIFFIPAILDAILTGISNFDAINSDYVNCTKCLLSPNDCDTSSDNLT